MAERPDQLCRRCATTVAEDDEWMGVERLAFHKRCFTCAKCAARLGAAAVHVQRDGRLACERCADAGAVLTAVEASRAGTPSGARRARRSAATCCAVCTKTLHGRVSVTVRGVNAYCGDCSKCHNCRRRIADAAGCFELLDELFCADCELEYRNKRYQLLRMGCGPPGVPIAV